MNKSVFNMTPAELRELPDIAKGKGIYFLWDGEELLYIGASTQVSDRVCRQGQIRDFGGRYASMTYRNTPRIPFKKATIYKWDSSLPLMADAEKALIRRYRPPYNELDEHGDTRWGWYDQRPNSGE